LVWFHVENRSHATVRGSALSRRSHDAALNAAVLPFSPATEQIVAM
jgi:hypothetical protein